MHAIKICCRGFEHVRQLADVNTLSSLRMLISDSILMLIHQISGHTVDWGCWRSSWASLSERMTQYRTLLLCKWTLCTGEPTLLNVYAIWFMLHNIFFIIRNVLWARGDLQFRKQRSEVAATSKQTCRGRRHNWWTVFHVGYQGNKLKVRTSPAHQQTSNSSPHGSEWLSACTSLSISSWHEIRLNPD